MEAPSLDDEIASTSQVVVKHAIKEELSEPEQLEEHDDGFRMSVKMEVETMDDCDFSVEFADSTEDNLQVDVELESSAHSYNKEDLHSVLIKTEASADDESDAETQMVIDEEAMEFSKMSAPKLKEEPELSYDDYVRSYEPSADTKATEKSRDTTIYKCAVCERIFDEKELFRKHLSEMHIKDQLVYACKRRGELMEMTAQAPDHLTAFVVHTRYRVVVHSCANCPEEFLTRPQYEKHQLLRHGPGVVDHGIDLPDCAMCGCTFLTREECNEHRCLVECKRCMTEFASCKGLVEHALNLIPLRLPCPCGWIGSGPGIKQHADRCKQMVFCCPYCPSVHVSLGSLKYHIEKHKKKILKVAKKRLPICRFCKKKYSGPYKLHNCPARSPRLYCQSCDAGFTTKTLRDLHLHDNKSPQPWSCDRCGMQVKLLCGRALHDKHYHGAMFPCFPCQLSFDLEADFNSHMAREHGKGVKKWCARCDEEYFETEEHVCDQSKCPFACDRCPERFWTQHELITHTVQGAAKRCPRCRSTFDTKCSMRRHGCPYKCGVCDANISMTEELAGRTCNKCATSVEAEDRAGVAKKFYFFCKFCVTGFPTKRQLEEHDEQNYGRKVRPCRVCAKMFLRMCASRAHRCVDLEEASPKFMCRLCTCTLSNVAQLRWHERDVHTGVDVDASLAVCGACLEEYVGEHECTPKGCHYSCMHCKLRFRYNTLLNTHEALNRLEEGPDSACSSCGAELQSECYRRLHACGEVHSCSFCRKGFVTKEFLTVHTLKHHVDLVVAMEANTVSGRRISFKCPKCVIVFESKWALDTHFRLSHTVEAATSEMIRVCKATPQIAIKKQSNVRTYGKRAVDRAAATATDDTTVNKVFTSSLGKVFRTDSPGIKIKQEVKEEPQELLDSLEVSEVVEVSTDSVKVKPEPVAAEEAVDCIEDFIANTDEIVLSGEDSEVESEPTAPGAHNDMYACQTCYRHSTNLSRYLHHYRHHGLPARQCPGCGAAVTHAELTAHVLRHVADNYGCSVAIVQKKNHSAVANVRGSYACGECGARVHISQLLEHWERHTLAGRAARVADTTRGPAARRRFAKQLARRKVISESEASDVSAKPGPKPKRRPPLNAIPSGNHKLQAKPGRLDAASLASVLARLVDRKSGDCELCQHTFQRNSDSKRHLIEHLVAHSYAAHMFDGRFVCDICGLKTSIVANYKQHLRDHGNLPLYQCQLCNKSFSDSSNFSKHKKVHGMIYMECDLCRRRFTSKIMLERHMEFHRTSKPLPCPKCPRIFYFQSSLRKHTNVHHERGNRAQFRCKICRSTFGSMKLKWEHQWREHGERKVTADCEKCPARFRNKQQLRAHRRDAHPRTSDK